MACLRLSLRHADLLDVPASITFMKHIEGSLSGPEMSLDEATNGDLQALLRLRERADFETLEANIRGTRLFAHIVNFHTRDLPFSYRSVDRYARSMLSVARRSKQKPVTFVTAIHGPGAGLDASEAMETLIRAFANELATSPALADSIAEVILVERQREVFERLQDRLTFLSEIQQLVSFSDGEFFVMPLARSALPVEKQRVEQLSLRHLFVAMPYAREFDNVYYFGIKLPIESLSRKCERVDQDAFTGDIVDRIKTRIEGSELVIADITGNNPNVFFEVGYAEGIGKTVILISQAQETPFDLKTRRQIRYDPQDLRALVTALTTQLTASLAETSSAKETRARAGSG